jgi:hypothetical protein
MSRFYHGKSVSSTAAEKGGRVKLIHTDHSFALLSQLWRLPIQAIDVRHFLVELLVLSWGQPVTDQMRLKINFFSKASPHDGARFASQCHAGRFHRRFRARSNG